MKASLRVFWTIATLAACFAVCGASAGAQDDPPPQAGRLSQVVGTVSVQQAGSDEWGGAYPNYPLGPGDRIYTDSDGRAEIQVGQTFVRLAANSDVTLVDATSNAITFGVGQGAVHINTLGMWPGQSLYVQTPSGSATVNSQANFRVDVIPSEQAAIFTDFYGRTWVSGAGGLGMNTEAHQALELMGTNPVYPEWLQPAYPDDLDRWSNARDANIARASSFRYVSPEIPGAYDLDASGDWMPESDYGAIWFPRVEAGWAPYRNGHWVNHHPWGWVWVEDEPWGYAPFHYGRWVNYHGRWGWVPGPPAEHPVWSPALVVFAGGVQSGGVGISVWFPLGPGEAYRPWYPCSPRYIDRVNISNIGASRVVHVQNTYVNVVNVTNVTNITYVNRTVGATGMRHEDFAAGRPVARAAVRVTPEQMQRVQVLARPQVAPTAQATIVRPQARPVAAPVARPVLINPQGKMVAARPNAAQVEPPVKVVTAPHPLPGRTVVAPPPGVRMPAPAQTTSQPQRPAYQPPQRPSNPPEQHPAQVPVPQRPMPQEKPVNPQPPARSQERTPPVQYPAPQPSPRSQDRPAPPAQQPPVQQPRPETHPETRQPAPPPPPHLAPPAQTRPAPENNPRPEAKPAPNKETKPAPPPAKDKKPDEKKDEDKQKKPEYR